MPEQVTVDYIRAFLPEDGPNGEVAYTYSITDCNGNHIPDSHDIASGDSADDNGNGLPDECECPGDFNNDGVIDLEDLSFLLVAYHIDDSGDLDADGDTDLSDLAMLLGRFGQTCP